MMIKPKASPIILRYGVITGLVITALSCLINYLHKGYVVPTQLGLYLIVSVPITSLITLGIEYLVKGEVRNSLLTLLTAVTVITSYVITLIH